MADYYAKSTGTKSSGASTADDWSDANCYGTIQAAIDALAADGDRIVLNDETFVIATTITDGTSGITTGTPTITVFSRGGEPSNCILSKSVATGAIWRAGNGLYSHSFIFENVGFTASVTHTDKDISAIYRRQNNASTVKFSGCKIHDITIDWGVQAPTVGALWNINSANFTLTLENTTIQNISVAANTTSIIAGHLLRTYATGQDVVFSGTNYLTGIVITQANTGAHNGAFYLLGDLTMSGNTYVSDITSTCPDASAGNHFAFFNCQSTADAPEISGVHVNDFTKTGGAHAGGVFRFTGTWIVSNGSFSNFTITEDTTNGLGGYVTSHGASANGVLSNTTVSSGTCQHGGALYNTQGGSGTAREVTVTGVTARGRNGVEAGAGAAFYGGGSGDTTLEFCVVTGCTADEAGAFYSQTNGGSKTNLIYNCTFSGNTVTGEESGRGGADLLISATDAYQMDITIKNSIFDSSATNSIQRGEGVSATLNSTFQYNYVNGGTTSIDGAILNGIDIGSTTDFATEHNISTDPLLTTSGRLTSTSPAIDEGTWISGVNDQGYADPWGKYVHRLPNIGADQGAGTPISRCMLLIGG